MMQRVRRILAMTCAGLGVLAAGGVASAGATLVYGTGGFPTTPPKLPAAEWVWSAKDNGQSPRRLARGVAPLVSPNGRLVVYEIFTRNAQRLEVVPAAGGRSRRLLGNVQDAGVVAWSPDSRAVAAVTGRELGTKRLILIDVASGTVRRTVASAPDFAAVSFSPRGDRLVYARTVGRQGSDLYTAGVSGGRPVALTRDHNSLAPVWGPRWIVFSRSRPSSHRNDAPKLDLYLVRPSGSGLHRLTHTNPGYLLAGLVATAWSADGGRLLAEFTGQDTSYAETVDPVTGRVRRLGTPAQGLIGAGLSRDGTTVLATTGGPDPGDSDVVAVPYTGGRLRTLARHARMPDWNAARAPR